MCDDHYLPNFVQNYFDSFLNHKYDVKKRRIIMKKLCFLNPKPKRNGGDINGIKAGHRRINVMSEMRYG